jgi:hypothetical protein
VTVEVGSNTGSILTSRTGLCGAAAEGANSDYIGDVTLVGTIAAGVLSDIGITP